MVSDAQRRAVKKWLSKPENQKKHNEWCLSNYHERRRKKFEEYADVLIGIVDREELINYLIENFNLKKKE